MTAKTKPLCGVCEAGWRYDDTDGTATRCPCRSGLSPEEARDEVMTAVEGANPNAFRDAYRIIADAARTNQHLSSNTVRQQMEWAQIPGPVVGAAFRKAAQEGLIEADGMAASTQQATHAHRVLTYRSRVYMVDHRAGVDGAA